MEVLVASSHDELERQMKQIEEQKTKSGKLRMNNKIYEVISGQPVSSEKEAQLTELLVELMDIKNDLNTIDHNVSFGRFSQANYCLSLANTNVAEMFCFQCHRKHQQKRRR